MAGVETTGNHAKALWPGVRAWFGAKYNKHPQEWSKIFDARNSEKNYEEDVEITGYGLAPVKTEAGSVAYDSMNQGATKRYTHVVYGLGFITSEEEFEDNLYKDKSFRRTEFLAFSIAQTEEIVAANVLNRAFNSSYTGADGKELLATDHPSLAGTWANELGTAADLSEASLEDLCTLIMEAKNSRGLNIALMPKRLIVPPALAFDAERILKSQLQSGSETNDINALRSMGLFSEGAVVNHYLTDSDAFFVKTNAPYGLTRFTRRAAAIQKDGDFDTGNMKCKSTIRFSVGWTDPRGLYGTPGA
ncbi:Mu-like prophage major head subunit gpT family protein [uncultured Paracoccus sp.]|uniref:phage major capsid protein n=1 Tax=uncultured Paracoccus sp. TaxID=189685 RepID=UPI0026046A5E|nr:Mu-like prophage major head subunit gpT family protein [uncultured Paracoccus sp.]